MLAVVERVDNAWSTLAEAPLAAGDPVRRELAAWARYEARRPVAWRGLG